MKHGLLAFTVLTFCALFLLAASPAGNDQSLFDQASSLEKQAKFIAAYDVLSNIKMQFPGSLLLPAAEYKMGLMFVYDDRPVEAALQFQQVISRFPSSDEARLALDMNALLYRLYIAPATDKRIFQPDSKYSSLIADLDNPVGLGVDPDGNAYLADRDKKILYTLDNTGKMINSATILSPYFVSITPNKQVLIANDSTVYVIGGDNLSFSRINPQTQAKAGYLEEIRSIAQNGKGEYFVVSGKTSGIAVYDHDKNPLPGRSLAVTEDFEKVALNPRGYVLALSHKGESVQVFDPDGKRQFVLSKNGRELSFGKIEDLAVDAACNIYLLTGNPRGVIIYSPQGKYLRFIASDKKSALSFDSGKVIAVGPTGSIYVLDKDAKKVLKLG